MIILGENTYLTREYKSNSNNMVIGAPGTGKSRHFVIPNLCEAEDESFVVLDAKGELYDITHKMMAAKGYDVRVVDFDNPARSPEHYNPLTFCRNSNDTIKISSILVDSKSNSLPDPFWQLSSRILCNSLIYYLVSYQPEYQRNLNSVMKLLRVFNVSEYEMNTSPLDKIFDEVREKDPSSWALSQYDLIKTAASRTLKSIIITLVAEFCGFMTPDIAELTSDNTIDFDKFCRQKTILYVKCSDIDRSKDKLVSIFFTQLFQELFRQADATPSHSLQRPVHVILDDIGSNLKIPDLDCIISCARGRNISLSLILQSIGQLKKNYVDYTSILNSCNNILFLGGNDIETCQEIALRLNKPLEDILYKEKNKVFVFCQGATKPITTNIYNLKSHPCYGLLNDNWVHTSKGR